MPPVNVQTFVDVLKGELEQFNGGEWHKLTAEEQTIVLDAGKHRLDLLVRRAAGEDVIEQVLISNATFARITSVKATQASAEFKAAFTRALSRLKDLVFAAVL